MVSIFLEFIAPKRCVLCQEYGSFFCEKCRTKILRQTPYCYICKNPSKNFQIHQKCREKATHFLNINQILVYGHYNGSLLKKAIQEAKFYHKKGVFEEFWKLLSTVLQENIDINKKEEFVLISAPMHFLRKWKRGYNHSALLTKSISKETGVRDISGALKKIRRTKQQSKLHKNERLESLKGAFQFDPSFRKEIEGKICIIVDDVVSTGATLVEIAETLKPFNPKKIIALALASD